jgi:hypothetical protein
MKPLRILFRVVAAAALLAALYLGGVIALGIATDYRPGDVVPIETATGGASSGSVGPELALLSWNIGYAGLGAEMDFFYDGGTMVRPSAAQAGKFTRGILDHLAEEAGVDFVLLQEVDKRSSRTENKDQTEILAAALPGYAHSFAYNYKVAFNPVPLTNPLGQIESGLMTLSRAVPLASERWAYHSAFPWPKQLFMLDRCFILSRFRTADGKDLVLINNHNSAFDAEGRLRRVEMPLIRDIMLRELEPESARLRSGRGRGRPLPGRRGRQDGRRALSRGLDVRLRSRLSLQPEHPGAPQAGGNPGDGHRFLHRLAQRPRRRSEGPTSRFRVFRP